MNVKVETPVLDPEHHTDLTALVDALFADDEVGVNQIEMSYVSHSGSSFGYLRLTMGTMGEERYDALRRVVNGLGGKVVIQDGRQDGRNGDGVNVYVWAKERLRDRPKR